MKKIVFLAVVALIIASCGNNSNSKTKIEQVRLDSIEQIKIDSLATVKIIQDSIVQIEIFER